MQPPPARRFDEQLISVIALMYQSAAEPELWRAFLDRINVMFRASFSNVGLVTRPEQMWWFDHPECLIQEGQDVNVVFQQGLSTEALYDLASRWLVHDGYTVRGVQWLTRIGQSAACDRRDLLSDAEFDRLPFCHEFALPHDYYHTLASFVLGETRELGLFLNVHRPRRYGPFEAREVALFRSLVPHLQHVLRVHLQWRALRQQTHSRTVALESVDQPCLTVNAHGQLLWANRAAVTLLDEGDGLQVRGGVLESDEPGEQPRLSAAIQRLGRSPDSARGIPRAGEALSLVRRRAAPRLHISLLRVPPSDPLGPAEGEVLLLLDSQPAEPDPLPSPAVLSQRYGLTAAESRVALCVARGMTVDQIAEEGQVSPGTVRNQLKQALDKTGTHRQAALVRLLLSLTHRD
ncbi:helix-turn-helix transcriptional regulator [Deinococcus sonorensis]|uniref:Helix-turn-helix transcriptional regulator n=2 Tax=Deinococcus sonorensis TaxID=309891 RepID=A0AAU7U5J1_9DEIO